MTLLMANDFGIILTDQCKKIPIKEVVDFLKENLKHQILEIDGQTVAITVKPSGNNGYRYWFTCPVCSKPFGILFKHPVSNEMACRKCLKLRYRKCAKKGMPEDLK